MSGLPARFAAPAARRIVLLGAFALALTACGGGGDEHFEEVTLPSRPVGIAAANGPVGTFVARTRDELISLAKAMWPLNSANVQPPEVDLSANMVIGINKGVALQCVGLIISRVTEAREEVRAEYHPYTPPPGTGCPAVVTDWAAFVQIPQVNKPVRFVEVAEPT